MSKLISKIYFNKNLSTLNVLFIGLSLTIAIFTLLKLNESLYLPYLILLFVSTASVCITFNGFVRLRSGLFIFLTSILFYLGFFFKFSFHYATGIKYREPTGNFNFELSDIQSVLITSTIGFLPLIINFLIFNNIYRFKKLKLISFNFNHKITASALGILLLSYLCYLNLRYNIILSILSPSIIIPFGGNAIFYILITRILPFVIIALTLNKFSIKFLIIVAFAISISSIGILSRMGIVSFLFYTTALVLYFYHKEKLHFLILTTLKVFIPIIFLSFSVASLSTELRAIFIDSANVKAENEVIIQTAPIKNVEQITRELTVRTIGNEKIEDKDVALNFIRNNLRKKINTFLELALQRWIGIEGVMAVHSIPNKSFNFFYTALLEPSYKGQSFFNKIATPNASARNTKELATTVPGPVAFFYYSGNLFFVFGGLTLIVFLISYSELVFLKISNNVFLTFFFSANLAFDFFQLGLSPISFFKYNIFTLVTYVVIYKTLAKYLKKSDVS